jgi:hypothetical protein
MSRSLAFVTKASMILAMVARSSSVSWSRSARKAFSERTQALTLSDHRVNICIEDRACPFASPMSEVVPTAGGIK